MYKINGLGAHHISVVHGLLDYGRATIRKVTATTIHYEDHNAFLGEVYFALAHVVTTAEDRRYLHTVKRRILRARAA